MIIVNVNHTSGDGIGNKILASLLPMALFKAYQYNIDWPDAVNIILAEYDAIGIIEDQKIVRLEFNTDALYTYCLLRITQHE